MMGARGGAIDEAAVHQDEGGGASPRQRLRNRLRARKTTAVEAGPSTPMGLATPIDPFEADRIAGEGSVDDPGAAAIEASSTDRLPPEAEPEASPQAEEPLATAPLPPEAAELEASEVAPQDAGEVWQEEGEATASTELSEPSSVAPPPEEAEAASVELDHGADPAAAVVTVAEPGEPGGPGEPGSPREPDLAREQIETGEVLAQRPAEPASDIPLAPAHKVLPVTPPGSDDDRPLIAPPPSRNRREGAAAKAGRGRSERGSRRSGAGSAAGAVHERAGRLPRVERGGTVMIDGEIYTLFDWSTAGLSIASSVQFYRAGDERRLELELDLGEYAVNLDLTGRVLGRGTERTAWEFVEPSETQRQVLRSLHQAALYGKPFNAARAGPAPAGWGKGEASVDRPIARPLAALLSLPLNAAVIALLAGLAIFAFTDGELPFTGGAVATGNLTRSAHAAVASERIALAAPTPGIVLDFAHEPGDTVGEGERMASVMSTLDRDATVSPLFSPCDCVLFEMLSLPGERVRLGEVVALLFERRVDAHVEAVFSDGPVPRPGDAVEVALPYSDARYEGVVDEVVRLEGPFQTIGLPGAVRARAEGEMLAKIRTEPALPARHTGEPALVSFRPDPD